MSETIPFLPKDMAPEIKVAYVKSDWPTSSYFYSLKCVDCTNSWVTVGLNQSPFFENYVSWWQLPINIFTQIHHMLPTIIKG